MVVSGRLIVHAPVGAGDGEAGGGADHLGQAEHLYNPVCPAGTLKLFPTPTILRALFLPNASPLRCSFIRGMIQCFTGIAAGDDDDDDGDNDDDDDHDDHDDHDDVDDNDDDFGVWITMVH